MDIERINRARELLLEAAQLLTPEQPPAEEPPAPPSAGEGRIVAVSDPSVLQSLIDSAAPGTTIVLRSGELYPPFVLPHKLGLSDERRITIRGDDGETPPTIVSRGDPAIRFEDRAAYYTLTKFRVRAVERQQAAVIEVGRPDLQHPDECPHHIILDALQVHAVNGRGRRGIQLSGRYIAIRKCQVCHFGDSADAQAIAGWNGPGPYAINNCYLSASGQAIIFGGADPANELMVPADIEITGCHMTKLEDWRWPDYKDVTVKNAFELKNARRVLVKGCLIERCWPDGQDGTLVMITPRNQGGKAPYSGVEDVTMTGNTLRDGATGIVIMGDDNLKPSRRTRGIRIENNVLERIAEHDRGWFLRITRGPMDVQIAKNRCSGGQRLAAFLAFGGRPASDFRVIDNEFDEGAYGITGDDVAPGLPAFAAYTDGDSQFSGNTIIGTGLIKYGPDNTKRSFR